MKFLIDEMFGQDLAQRLEKLGHAASHVGEFGLAGARDRDVLARASEEDLVVVTENAVDFIPLLDSRIAAALPACAVVIALKSNLPPGAGAMHHALASKLDQWAQQNADPYRHVHFLP